MIVADDRFRPWLEQRVRMQIAGDAKFIGVLREGKVVAACAFSHWSGPDIEMSVAGEAGSGSRRFLNALFDYVFVQLKCRRCTVKTRASNTRAIKLATRLGFKQEGVLRAGYGDEDAFIFGLLETDYGKWRRKTS